MTVDEVLEVVRASAAKVLDVDASVLTLDGTLSDLGANSVDRADIVTQSMLELDVKVPVRALKGVSNVRSLVGVLHSHLT